MAASRARWPVTASRTGRGGKAEPALLKWRTLATPGVSDLSDATSSFMTASSYARGASSRDSPIRIATRRGGSGSFRRDPSDPRPRGPAAPSAPSPPSASDEMDVRVKHRLARAGAVILQDVVLVQLERDSDALDERENLGQLRAVEVVQVRRVPAREEDAVAGGARLADAQDADRARTLRHERQPRRAGGRLAEQATAVGADVRLPGAPAALDQRAHRGDDAIGRRRRASPVVEDASAHVIGGAACRAATDGDVPSVRRPREMRVQPADEPGGVERGIEVEAEDPKGRRRGSVVDGDELAPRARRER